MVNIPAPVRSQTCVPKQQQQASDTYAGAAWGNQAARDLQASDEWRNPDRKTEDDLWRVTLGHIGGEFPSCELWAVQGGYLSG